MNAKVKADELNVISLAKKYSNETRARRLFEKLRWPNGKPICPHCKNDGETKVISKLTPKAGSKSAVRKGVYFCGACRKPFTATVGTVFEDSHVPISKILMAIFILCSSKKSVSAMQLMSFCGYERLGFAPDPHEPDFSGSFFYFNITLDSPQRIRPLRFQLENSHASGSLGTKAVSTFYVSGVNKNGFRGRAIE